LILKLPAMDINRKIKISELKTVKRSNLGKKLWIVLYSGIAIIAMTMYILVKRDALFQDKIANHTLVEKLLLGSVFVCLILLITKLLERAFVRRAKIVYTRYNRIKMVRLLSWILIAAVVIAFLFKNWYSAAVSLGLISLILGFALQSPIASFIGWIYILIRQSYHVGDRIQIDQFRGDVVEVNYLDTTIWEFTSDYMPSGRLIRFPNSLVLQMAVSNYSWEKFPFIWSDLSFQLAYESDLQFVEDTIKRIATDEFKDMAKNIEHFKKMIDQTPVEEIDVSKYPYVSLRTNANTWIEITVTYLVHPNNGAATRTRIIKRILAELNSHPDRVMFPKSNAR